MLHLAIAQLKPRKGAYAENVGRLRDIFRRLGGEADPPDLIVLPETALTGYFVEGGVRELARSAEQVAQDLAEAHRESGAPPVDVATGFYELWQTRLYNSGLVLGLGEGDPIIRHVHRKVFLPTYGVFDEERFVEPGRSVRAFDAPWGRGAIIICEDAWHSLVPTIAALDGAQLVIVPSASPARGLMPGDPGENRPASLVRWERTIQMIAGEHGVYVALAQLVGFEGGKAFPGGSLVCGPRGDIVARSPVFEEDLLRVTLDLGEIARARADLPLLSDLESRLPHLVESLEEIGEPVRENGDGRGPERRAAPPPAPRRPPRPPRPSLPPEPSRLGGDPLQIDPELTRRWLVEFLKDEVIRRRGFTNGVLGLSGGLDSAVVAFLAAEALGPESVTALRLPYRSSSPESLAHAQLVIDRLGVRSETLDITAAVDGLVARLADPPTDARLGNICARMRMVTLFDRSAALGALPIGTGNKTERLFGYFTWHADDSPPVNPVGDLFKTQLWPLARHLGVPAAIIEKPPTADLVPGQTDEGDFGISFAKADAILHWILLGYGDGEVAALGFAAEEVALVRRRLDSTHWKRKLPTVAMVSQTAIGEYYLRPVDY